MSREIRNQWATQPINTLRLKVTGQWGEAIALTAGNVQQLKEPINFQPPKEVNTSVPAEDVGGWGWGSHWFRLRGSPADCTTLTPRLSVAIPGVPRSVKDQGKTGIIYNYRKRPEDVINKHFKFTEKPEAERWRKSPFAPLNTTTNSIYYSNMLASWWIIDIHDNIWKKKF